jgi:hypothetical protein
MPALPDPVTAYFASDPNADVAALALLFTADGRIAALEIKS